MPNIYLFSIVNVLTFETGHCGPVHGLFSIFGCVSEFTKQIRIPEKVFLKLWLVIRYPRSFLRWIRTWAFAKEQRTEKPQVAALFIIPSLPFGDSLIKPSLYMQLFVVPKDWLSNLCFLTRVCTCFIFWNDLSCPQAIIWMKIINICEL